VTTVSRRWHVVNEQLDLFRFEAIAKQMAARRSIDVFDALLPGCRLSRP
jgi:hypothetical protein